MEELKRLICLISICLIIFSASLVAAQQITVSRGQTFTVHVSVYKPENISFPADGARLFAGLCNPDDYIETYNVSGWGANTIYLQWDNEERRENFSLEVTVKEDAPTGKGASLRVLLVFDNNPIYASSSVVLALEAVEVEGERVSKYMPGTLVGPPSSPTGNYYFIVTTDVVIAAAEPPLPLWALAVMVVLVVLVIVVVAVGWKKHGIETPSPPTGPEWE